ncbi:MAG: DUF1585 domain-containing protein [Deltaproteobacteria bacterium]|nr:DUF1585 domain-containing protein [Deltaproteobacteria bacterium]
MTRRISRLATLAALTVMAAAPAVFAQRSLDEYRFFRSLSIDLQGRIPTRAELTAFEQPSFNAEAWIDARLPMGPAAERMRVVYMDRLRLALSTVVTVNPLGTILRRIPVTRANGTVEWVYFRRGQRREDPAIDGSMCFTPRELGVQYPTNGDVPATSACNTPRPITDAMLNERTVLVRPWWLYRDYRAATPSQRYDAATWQTLVPGYQPVDGLLTDQAGAPVMAVRVCREEAGVATTGRPFVRTVAVPPAETGCNRRLVGVPNTNTDAMALVAANQRPLCSTQTGFNLSTECGCGPGLERCLPGAAVNNLVAGNMLQGELRRPLGQDAPLESTGLNPSNGALLWWSEEATHFLDAIFRDDRDIRDLLRARDTVINGPLAHFYRHGQQQSCCTTNHLKFDYNQPVNLFDPTNVPSAILQHDVDRWTPVANRGPLASGLLTMPIFLSKYGTRRARAHILYQAFLCKEFIAPNVALMPSNEPNLARRTGCSGCHATLEPMSAFYTRVSESDWTYLPAANFPLDNARCRTATPMASMPSGCAPFYDPSFTTAARSWMRGIYDLTAAQPNANAGPAGLANYIVAQPEFAGCVVDNIAESLLGRELTSEDTPLRTQLTTTLRSSNFRPRAMVRQLILSDAYRRANNLSSTAWREGGAR